MPSKTLASFLAVVTLVLYGCGTTPTPMTQATAVPKERVFAKTPVSSQYPATLTLVRDTGLQGIEHVFEFWVNGLQLADLRAGEKLITLVEPGAVILEVRIFNILGKIAPAQIETTFAPGKSYVYRAGVDDTPRLHLSRDVELSR
jgi:hypothetical protein